MRDQDQPLDDALGAFVTRLKAMPSSDARSRAAILARVRGRRQAPWRTTLAMIRQPSVPLLAAAAVAVIMLGIGYGARVLSEPDQLLVADAQIAERTGTQTPDVVPVSNTSSVSKLIPQQFFIEAPGAKHVALVGDFNGWDSQVTALSDPTRSGVWSVTVMLPPGRHTYAFLVNDSTWKVDPRMPAETDPDFGRERSVRLVGTER